MPKRNSCEEQRYACSSGHANFVARPAPHAAIDASRIADFELPANTDVLVSPYLAHRHPRYWRDADRVDLDRFLPDAVASRQLPFPLGPRACIAKHMALNEMHAHAIMLARRFKLSLAPGQSVEIEAHVNLRPRRPLQMNVELR